MSLTADLSTSSTSPSASQSGGGDLEAARALHAARDQITQEIHKVIIGQDEVIQTLLTALFARGHCLFVGVPGLAKTLLISTLARALNLSFNRIQFTPDLMPSDITGSDILEEDPSTGQRRFRFIRGPVFANILLADEINRTPPKTQAALLQSMQEHRVTAGGHTHELDLPYLVFATQNPVEQEGTYPLPEAQLDRFMFMVDVSYPGEEDEIRIVLDTTSNLKPEVKPVLSAAEIIAFQDLVTRVPVADNVARYAVQLVRASRPKSETAPDYINEYLAWGAGPRASQYLILAGKARALLDGRYAVEADDVRALAQAVLVHRLLPNFHAEAEGVKPTQIITRLLETIRPQ